MQRIADIINDSEILPVEVAEHYLSRTGDIAAAVESAVGSYDKRYVNGGGVIEHPFALYVRAPEMRTATDFDAYAALKACADELESHEGITAADTPNIVGRDASDNVYWRLDGVIRYIRGSQE